MAELVKGTNYDVVKLPDGSDLYVFYDELEATDELDIGVFEVAAEGPTQKSATGAMAMQANLSKKLMAKRAVQGFI
jgi:hypothetical protein